MSGQQRDPTAYSEVSQIDVRVVTPFLTGTEGLEESILIDQLFTLKPLVDALGIDKAVQVATQKANEGKHNDIIPILREEQRKLTGGAPAPPGGTSVHPGNAAASERDRKLLEKKEKEAKKKLEKARKEKEKKEKKEKEKLEKEARKKEKQEKKEREKREKMEKQKKAKEAQAKKDAPHAPGNKKEEPRAEGPDVPAAELNLNGEGDQQVNIAVGGKGPDQGQAPPAETEKSKEKHSKSKAHQGERTNAGAPSPPPPPPPPLDPIAEKVRQTEEELAKKYNFRQEASGVAPSTTGEFRMVFNNFVSEDTGEKKNS